MTMKALGIKELQPEYWSPGWMPELVKSAMQIAVCSPVDPTLKKAAEEFLIRLFETDKVKSDD